MGLNPEELIQTFGFDQKRIMMDLLTGNMSYYMWISHFILAKYLNTYCAMIPGSIYMLKIVLLVHLIYIRFFILLRCVQAVVRKFEQYIKGHGQYLPSKASLPISVDYRSEINVYNELGPQEADDYQCILGIICWIIELGSVGINGETLSLLHVWKCLVVDT